jgi:hypothetical protein
VILTGQENEVGEVSEHVEQSNDLGGQSAARAPNSLTLCRSLRRSPSGEPEHPSSTAKRVSD